MVECAKKARKTKVSATKSASTGMKKSADGKIDLCSKEGKTIAERMEKVRQAIGNLLKRLFK